MTNLNKSTRIMSMLLALFMLFQLFSVMPIKAEAAAADTDQHVTVSTAGGASYVLFASGRTGRATYYSSNSNVDENSKTNGGYDLYSRYNNTAMRNITLGRSFTIDCDIDEVAELAVYSYDIDESSGEIDRISLVDETAGTIIQLGKLSGMDESWNNTTFRIDPSSFVKGHTYHFELTHEVSGWVSWTRNVTLTVNGSDVVVSPVTGVESLSATADIDRNMLVTVDVTSKGYNEATYDLEIKATAVSTEAQHGQLFSEIDVKTTQTTNTYTFNLESGAPEGTYRIDVYLKNQGDQSVAKTATTMAATESYSSVAYNPNGGSNNIPLDNTAYVSGDSVTVLFNYIPSRSGYKFLGWSTNASAASPTYTRNGTNTFTIGSSDVVLYAIWQRVDSKISVGTAVASKGAVVEVPVSIWGNPGFVMAALTVDYDKDALTLQGVTDGGILGTAMHTPNYALYPYQLTWHNPTVTQNITANGVIATLIFKVADNAPVGTYNISISYDNSDFDIVDFDYNPVEFACEAGSVTVEDHIERNESKAATCTESGYERVVCSCGEVKSEVYIPSLGHDYTSVVTKHATCTESGSIKYTCTRCNSSYTVTTYSEHNYVSTVIEPTCTEDGATVYTCTKCGDVNKVVIPAEHDYVAEVTKKATRTEDGEIKYTCSKCGHSYTEVIPASNANVLVIQNRIPWDVNNIPTLLNSMKAEGYITGWTMTTTSKISEYALEDFDVILIANDQTTSTYNELRTLDSMLTDFVNNGGSLIYGACDHGWAAGDISYNILGEVEKTDYYSMRNYIVDVTHPIVLGSLTDDKAITNDLLLGTYCSHSGFEASTLPNGYNIILQDAQGNATLVEYPMGDGMVILSGLTWEFYFSRIYTGSTSYSKNVFDDLVAYAAHPVSACAHVYDAGTVVAPTCTTEGYTLHTCSVCGSNYKDNYQAALGHNMATWIIDTEATCTNPGSKHQTCTRCGETITEVIPSGSHVHSEWMVVKVPTETEPGLRQKVCIECGQVIATEEIAYNAALMVESKVSYPGKTVSVPVTIAANPGITIAAITVEYDSSVLTLKNVLDGGILGSAMHSPTYNRIPYTLYWSNTTANHNFTNNGILAYLEFEVDANAAVGTYPIKLSYDNSRYDIVDKDMLAVDFAVYNGAVHVGVPVESVALDITSADVILGDSLELNATVYPSNATEKDVIWSSDNPAAVTVSDDGVVTAVGEGSAVITATTKAFGKTASCTINVIIPVTGVSLDTTSTELMVGNTVQLIATVNPSNATNKAVTWTSSDDTIATVSNNGVVTGVGEGTVTITVTTVDGQKTASCEVEVYDFIYGDVDKDRQVTNRDSAIIARHLARWAGYDNDNQAYDFRAADVDCDGQVTNRDSAIVARHLARWADYLTLPKV